jgi:hypothetical protein
VPAIWHSAKTFSLTVNKAPPHSLLSLSQSHHTLTRRSLPHRPDVALSRARHPAAAAPCRHFHAARPLPAILRPPAPPRRPHADTVAALPAILTSSRSPPLPAILTPPRRSPAKVTFIYLFICVHVVYLLVE